MKKLTLESLEVTSFETSEVPPVRGTLRAHEDARPPTSKTCNDETCFSCPTSWENDCTYGCSFETNCYCGPLSEFGCETV